MSDINNLRDAQRVLENVSYKKGWRIYATTSSAYMHVTLYWRFDAPDYTKLGAPDRVWESRKWTLSLVGLTEDALVKTALAAALQTEEHECREAFTYKGVRLFNPHTTIAKLMEAQCP